MGLKPTCQTTTIPAPATITRPRPPPRTSAPTTSSSEPTSTPTSTTPTSTSTTSATPSTSSTSSSASIPIPKTAPGKRGLAYNDPRLTQPFSGPDSPVSWAYNWFSMPYSNGQPSTGFNPALEFVPILWSNAPGATSVWAANVKSCISKYGTAAVLAFNEPDQCGNGGSCIQVPDAVSAY
ncbi:Uncharacterised protein family, glycosyl hydrolase catalytic domain [Lasallia pustulata]|uniref:Uncharacterized protein family, glycosyl hydrolase catalytic domain n=1 Tax=Lasallia pustulata TaxID=136370 RepID=A0A1W5D0A0_9LECA|nr:Uncharacterised protein family, glycosyl hydrolase catalytic domain [Lasallia pustulata]